jgi:hypothetical protein
MNVRQPAPAVAEALWTVGELARFLNRSPRWVRLQLARSPEEAGSLPHVKLPSPGRRRQVRFIPATIRAWLEAGCPSIRDFEGMQPSVGGGAN